MWFECKLCHLRRSGYLPLKIVPHPEVADPMPILSNLKGGIEVEVWWSDQDLTEYQFRCSNGRFSGHAEIYLNHDDLAKMAEDLRGFPSRADDSREFELGTFTPKHADGGIRMHFYCTDSVGHAAVDVKLRGDACKALGEVESVALRIPIEAASVDSFVAQIKRMEERDRCYCIP
jgi:hypothetical protein